MSEAGGGTFLVPVEFSARMAKVGYRRVVADSEEAAREAVLASRRALGRARHPAPSVWLDTPEDPMQIRIIRESEVK